MINLSKKKVRYVYLEMEIHQSEFQHDHRVLFVTHCENIEFAVRWYIAHYWGEAERDGSLIWLNSDMIIKRYRYINLTTRQYATMREVMYS